MDISIRDRARGVMVGLAVGDALGAPVEFMTYAAIVERYGLPGITELRSGKVTDDTQMSMCTAGGIIDWDEFGRDDVIECISMRYKHWEESDEWYGRAPGGTCMAAISSGRTVPESKGCGGVMRVAPVGIAHLYGKAAVVAAQVGHITHGHPTSDASCAYLGALIDHLVGGVDSIWDAFSIAIGVLADDYPDPDTFDAVTQAALFAKVPNHNPLLDIAEIGNVGTEAPHAHGKGWVAEEALGIGLYASLLHSEDFESAIITAANISGDSDSTASIAGAISGAYLGMDGIPERFVERVEYRDELISLADELVDIRERTTR